MALIDKETIRAEIERRRNEWLAKSRLIKKGRGVAMYAAGKSSAYAEFLSLLDTLPEQPVDGLEEEIATWIPNHIKCEKDPDLKRAVIKWAGFVARHFAEWGTEHARKEDK